MFVLILPATTRTNARTVCRRLQRQLSELDHEGERLTTSMGIASSPDDAQSLERLVHAAEFAVQEAKCRGGDRIGLADTENATGKPAIERGRRSHRHMRALASAAAAAGVHDLDAAMVAIADGVSLGAAAVFLTADGTPRRLATSGEGAEGLEVYAVADDGSADVLTASVPGLPASLVVRVRYPETLDTDDSRFLALAAAVIADAIRQSAAGRPGPGASTRTSES